MEARKLVLMNLRNRDTDIENGCVNTVRKGRVGRIERLGLTNILYHV